MGLSLEPLSYVYCFRLNFNISKLGYYPTTLRASYHVICSDATANRPGAKSADILQDCEQDNYFYYLTRC